VLAKIKSEQKYRDRVSADMFGDIDGTKNHYDENLKDGKIKGFIREIGYNPFGFLLISQIQVINLKNKSTVNLV
jgi:hypothetical protein